MCCCGKRYGMQNYTAIVKQEGEWWFGWIGEIPGVNCQERSKNDLMSTLRETLREAIKMNRDEALLAKKICKDLGVPPI